jgi:hypothetical protein
MEIAGVPDERCNCGALMRLTRQTRTPIRLNTWLVENRYECRACSFEGANCDTVIVVTKTSTEINGALASANYLRY